MASLQASEIRVRTYRLTSTAIKSDIDYQAALNDQQLAAVDAPDGANLIIAGAGTGKTRTLTYRVGRLIDRGVNPNQLLLCTFTNKAAREMLMRVEHLVGGRCHQVWGGTFHHVANRLLRIHGHVLDLAPEYTILDAEDARDLLGDCSAGKHLTIKPAMLADLISFAVNTQTPFEQVVLERSPTLMNRLDQLGEIARSYRRRKREMNVLDFDDLLEFLHKLLENSDQLEQPLTERFQHVLVDEYQDTTPLQCRIVDGLAAGHQSPTVVGDDAQSIYGFRGADPANIFTFTERWPEARLFKLETNYRSTPQVLNLANAAIVHNHKQISKQLRGLRPDGPMPALIPVQDADMQAAFVAQRITDLVDEGIDLNQIAVLYRAHHHSMELQIELTRRQIPYLVRSGVRFFEQAHIKDVLAFLRVVENPRDELAWLRIFKLQTGIGRTGAARIWEQIRATPNPLVAVLDKLPQNTLAQRSQAGFDAVKKTLGQLRKPELAESIRIVLDSGYGALLPNLYPNADQRLEDIEQLAAYAGRFSDRRAFLAELNLLASFASERDLAENDDVSPLILSSIHQAKGLEFKAVFVLMLNEGAFPHARASRDPDQLDEERRLFYVASTRAMDELYLLTCQVSDRPGQRRILMKPSRFIEEISTSNTFELWQVE